MRRAGPFSFTNTFCNRGRARCGGGARFGGGPARALPLWKALFSPFQPKHTHTGPSQFTQLSSAPASWDGGRVERGREREGERERREGERERKGAERRLQIPASRFQQTPRPRPSTRSRPRNPVRSPDFFLSPLPPSPTNPPRDQGSGHEPRQPPQETVGAGPGCEEFALSRPAPLLWRQCS